jgi:hypothetical protein
VTDQLKRARKRMIKAIETPALVSSDDRWYLEAPKLLGDVARALKACEDAKLAVSLAHGAVISEAGYVFKIGHGWEVRTRNLTEFGIPSADRDE